MNAPVTPLPCKCTRTAIHAHSLAATKLHAALDTPGRTLRCRRLARSTLPGHTRRDRAGRARRIQRHLAQSRLPGGKTCATIGFKVLTSVPRAQIEALAAGDWVETGANLTAIDNSGTGKTHLLSAIGHALVEARKRVLYTRATDLVQKLQAARRDLDPEAALAKLDKFDLVILDDIT